MQMTPIVSGLPGIVGFGPDAECHMNGLQFHTLVSIVL